MARSTRRRDRVVSFLPTGAPDNYGANGTLPRGTYRDDERLSGTLAAFADAQTNLPIRVRRTQISFLPSPYKQAKPSKARFLQPWRWFSHSDLPHRVLFCVKRKQRREVLFALNRAGYRGSAPKKFYRRTSSSKYGC